MQTYPFIRDRTVVLQHNQMHARLLEKEVYL